MIDQIFSTQCRTRTLLEALCFARVLRELVPAPILIAETLPLIVVFTCAFVVDHGIDGTATTKHLASRPEHLAIIAALVFLGVECPICSSTEKSSKASWNAGEDLLQV